MRFFRKEITDKSLALGIKKRWLTSNCGLILDSKRIYHPVWRVDSILFDDFLSGIERRSGLSLGRRLAHASSESEEFISIVSNNSFPKGRKPERWKNTKLDWLERGIGNFELLDDDSGTRFLIKYPINGPLCSGVFTANWERATGKRHKFRWNHNDVESLILMISEDHMKIPQPSAISPPWFYEKPVISLNEDIDFWDSLEVESDKYWSIMGRRFAMINQDVILRFESYFLPYLEEIHEGRKESYSWAGVDKKRSLLWTIFSDTIREIFYSQKHHILISGNTDWIHVSKRHLERQGLGKIDSVISIDEFGGIEVSFSSCYHPAIFSGIMSGCWERANGRSAKCDFYYGKNSNTIRLVSMNEISLD